MSSTSIKINLCIKIMFTFQKATKLVQVQETVLIKYKHIVFMTICGEKMFVHHVFKFCLFHTAEL